MVARRWSSQASFSSSSSPKAAEASKIHSQAEKMRRARINAHLSTLRSMIPTSNKIDKASLLGEVVNRIKDLNRQAFNMNQIFLVPKESNEVMVELSAPIDHTNHHDNCSLFKHREPSFIKASICCDDRPKLMGDLMEAFNDLGLRAVRAELVTVGGRVKNIFLLSREEHSDSSMDDVSSTISLEESVREVLGRIVSEGDPISCGFSSRRTRLLHS